MDLSKAKKPLHIKCPYCKKDLQYNGASIKSRKEGMIKRLESLKRQLREAKTDVKKENLKQKINKTEYELKLLSEDIHMLSQMSEIETLKIFKRKVRKMISEEDYIRLCEESESEYLEENTFNYYDLAIQRFNNFANL